MHYNGREHHVRRPPKYRNNFTEYDGRTYASRAEADRARALDFDKQSGVIKHWEPQPRFRLGCAENVYVADFIVWHMDGTTHVEDVKGFESAKFKRDCRLWRRYGPVPLHVISRNRLAYIVEPDDGIPIADEEKTA
jgi:hypothetical protein